MAEMLDGLAYRLQSFRHKKENTVYLQQHPEVSLPEDYVLYETYQLNYRKFIEDGKLAASEIISWTRPYIQTKEPRILDWGCGAGRITRHIRTFHSNAIVYGCDTTESILQWNRNNDSTTTYSIIDHFTPTLYAPGFFNLVFGFSVLTHIDAAQQKIWIEELYRIINSNGILLITTQGAAYFNKVLLSEKKEIISKGIFTKSFQKKGHRMMSTYHHAVQFRKLLNPYFEVLEFHEGQYNKEKAGGQDMWVLRKKGE
jgi:2-polyprenyl-3-methyl-5-hydroxy-6-metoxy-1,4-benzoquinol methylase